MVSTVMDMRLYDHDWRSRLNLGGTHLESLESILVKIKRLTMPQMTMLKECSASVAWETMWLSMFHLQIHQA